MTSMITLALSKGRILDDTLPVIAKAGIEPIEDLKSTRKLIIPTNHENLRLLIVRATDVPAYVQSGAADIGIVGKDTLMEFGGEHIYELADLHIAKCKLMLAKIKDAELPSKRLRVASKFVNITRRHFASKGEQVDVIKLYGSMEIAPLVGIADVIVDIVDTGNTLRANGLEPYEFIMDVSSRLVANKSSMKQKYKTLSFFVDVLIDTTQVNQEQKIENALF